MTSSTPNTPADATPEPQADADPTAVSGGIPAHEPSDADLQSTADTSTPTDEVPETAAESGAADDEPDRGEAATADRPSPFSSPADLQTAGIRDADHLLAESEDASGQARDAAQGLRGAEQPETVGDGTDLPAAPDAETRPRQPE
ncbi:hypothetical protein FDO65_00525 [Nakamurella flava]|uniref:Uncharacterized protein n=1 Tax=Nakamurella flava TaxID=2576308 RepID=A0A4V6CS57_9ACTN|nr:hypothetical protein [Nakamurella flava]TKV60255.1 hypothetical protein FDO65_00525 [Nakamurella flava]